MTDVTFASLGIAEPIQRALAAENYTIPTPIQAQAIPALLAGRDLLGIAQTGTGKTAAFGLPLLQKVSARADALQPKSCGALILAPTRELAIQIAQSLRTYSRFLGVRHAVVFGGVSQNPQVAAMKPGVDILVATPGRLLDLVKQGHIRLDRAATFIIDEADRMFDMGFIRDVRRIVGMLPKERQSMLFSATMPEDVVKLIGDTLKNPHRVEITPQATTVDRIEQRVHFVPMNDKRALLQTLLRDEAMARVIVFTGTKHRANRVTDYLNKAGFVAEALHGGKSQNARQRALENFKAGKTRLMVATDIAARGIDVDDVTHVVNFDLPNLPDSYVHRIGRTARAGATGVAISFCDPSERGFLRDIEREIRQKVPAVGTPELEAEVVTTGAPHPHPHGQNNGHKPGSGKHAPRDNEFYKNRKTPKRRSRNRRSGQGGGGGQRAA